MLKALELTGFKSFADRTRFEFPHGVSMVVGPNGSGKSNIVDAVKWALGSQSPKSLRGQEMVDVIFNGSASRGPLGTAEVTLTLDNSGGQLPIDASDVHITRRVYRSGEGEYLINRQPCRLRDIRELLSGTGITTEAYCIIEQGKVDLLLQSSPRERRVIFEEAAGISQFKFKKATATRRLERVEQNLLRLSDIVDEVESRLRSVRLQAGKARRYRECTTRLQHLRTHVGLVDWRVLTRRITARDAQLAELERRHKNHESALTQLETDGHRLEEQREAVALRQRDIEAQASAVREQIAAHEAGLETQSARRSDVEQEIARFRRQLAAMSSRAGGATDQLRDAADALCEAEAQFAAAEQHYHRDRTQAEAAGQRLDATRAELKTCRASQAEAAKKATQLSHQVTRFESQLRAAQTARQSAQSQLESLVQHRDAHSAELANRTRQHAAAQAQVEASQANVRAIESRLEASRRETARVDKQQRRLEAQYTRTRERIDVLTELHERLEGLNSGVKDVLLAARDAPDGPLGEVLGVVADLFHVDVDSAPLVDMALGEQSQFLVALSTSRLFEWLDAKPLGVSGRVGFLRLEFSPKFSNPLGQQSADSDDVDLSSEPGVMGRADRFVETTNQFVPLVQRLLGRTWFVDRLSTALRLAQTAGRGLDYVTSDGELLRADGTLVIGPRQASAGLLSRRSELRACHEQLAELEKQLGHQQSLQDRLQADHSESEQRLAAATIKASNLSTELAEYRHHMAVVRGRLEQASDAANRLAIELQQADAETEAIRCELASAHSRLAELESASVEAQLREQATLGEIAQLEQQVLQLQAAATEKRVVAARYEQRVEILRSQLEQAQRDQQERDQALVDTRGRLAQRQNHLDELDSKMLTARQALAELFICKQRHAHELAEFTAIDEQHRQARGELHERIRHERQQLGALQSQQHKLEIAVSKLRHERQTLAERMQDDYGIDLAAEAEGDEHPVGSAEQVRGGSDAGVTPSAQLPATDRDAIEREISELRNQVNQIGAVNLDALEELDALESRFGGLSQQYRDLVDAKASLERIIQRINVDSRQLFLATLEVVRGHFRDLYRRLFGGGEADILLEEGEDVLECGIDVVACPPGKEACSISLLSGGEKTLTCVALLLAVFRSKPSPFCMLDEVDAALDESNIGRFVQVLREFLSFTRFVVVTHSKKTMSGADTLYGVTMEESGVSKQVSVRFEDVSEDGHIKVSRGDARRAA